MSHHQLCHTKVENWLHVLHTSTSTTKWRIMAYPLSPIEHNPQTPNIKWLPSFDVRYLPCAYIKTFLKLGASCPRMKMCACEWKRVIVNKIIFYQAIHIPKSTSKQIYLIVYQNGNVSMHHIPSCIMSSCIMSST